MSTRHSVLAALLGLPLLSAQGGPPLIGWVTQISVAYSAVPRDLAALRAMSDSAKKEASGRPLTVAEQDKVSEMIRFMRKRCPP